MLDYLFAHHCLQTVLASGAKKDGGGKFSLDDFLIFPSREKPKKPIELMRALFGHRVVRKPREEATDGAR